MFVIVQALENLSDEERRRPVAERIGLTMKSAGVAITVTSMTDILAFAAGAVTVPSAASPKKNKQQNTTKRAFGMRDVSDWG